MSKDKKCADLIEGQLKGRLEQYLPDFTDENQLDEYIRDIGLDVAEDEDKQEKAQEHFQDYGTESVLCIDKITSYRVLLGTGGPEDYFVIHFNSHGEVEGGEYWYKNWLDGASVIISASQAEELAQVFCVGPDFE